MKYKIRSEGLWSSFGWSKCWVQVEVFEFLEIYECIKAAENVFSRNLIFSILGYRKFCVYKISSNNNHKDFESIVHYCSLELAMPSFVDRMSFVTRSSSSN